MKKLLLLAAAGVGGWLVARPRRSSSKAEPRPPDLTHADLHRPQEPVEEIERRVDVPGGVRP